MKIVGKMILSKNRTRQRHAIPASPLAPMAAEMKMTQPVMKPKYTIRGLMNLMAKAPENRPMAKSPCAIASRFEPVALVVPGRTSTT